MTRPPSTLSLAAGFAVDASNPSPRCRVLGAGCSRVYGATGRRETGFLKRQPEPVTVTGRRRCTPARGAERPGPRSEPPTARR